MSKSPSQARIAAIALSVAALFFVAGWGLRSLWTAEPAPPAVAPQPPPVAPAQAPPTPKPAPKSPDALVLDDLGEAPYFGAREPLVTVMVCTDFQCPVCARAAREMYKVMTALQEKVRFEIRNNALEMHRNAKQAAIAALAAHRQGKFWAMHDGMFEYRQLTEDGLLAEARRSGLDIERYLHDIKDPALARQVEAESKLCRALGARGTPAYFVDGERHVGWGSAFGFQRIVEKHIGYAEALLDAGTPRVALYRALASEHASEPEKFVSMVLDHIVPAPSPGL